jgi:hypothetical protein
MLLIAFSVFIAVIIFSATQFQVRLAGLTLFGGPLSVWKAEQLREGWSASLDVLDAAKKAHAASQQVLAKVIAAGRC